MEDHNAPPPPYWIGLKPGLSPILLFSAFPFATVLSKTHFYKIKAGGEVGRSTLFISKRLNQYRQIIPYWEENSLEINILLRYLEYILISQFYGWMADILVIFSCPKKIESTWSGNFELCNYFFKFRYFVNAFMTFFAKYIIVHRMAKFKYSTKQIIYLKSSGQLLLKYMFHVLKVWIFFGHFKKIVHKIVKSKYFTNI